MEENDRTYKESLGLPGKESVKQFFSADKGVGLLNCFLRRHFTGNPAF